ncbi:MAG: hypothetical protein LUH22_09780 [Bacteroides sp.]|nr:hypothetical protein [Bacteroides sp.]
MKKNGRRFLHVFIFVAACAVIAAITMLLWNALIPAIIGWNAINYWQAAGLLILCRLLFGGMGRHFHRRKFHPRGGHLHHKLEGMSFEERREYIRKRMSEMRNE